MFFLLIETNLRQNLRVIDWYRGTGSLISVLFCLSAIFYYDLPQYLFAHTYKCALVYVKCDFIIQMILSQKCMLFFRQPYLRESDYMLFYTRIDYRGQEEKILEVEML